MLPAMALLAASGLTGAANVTAERGDPTREELQLLLLTEEDLLEATGKPWIADRLVTTGVTGPAGTTEPSGCTALDTAVLAQNTGLTDSGVQPFYTAAGDILEQTVVYDPAGSEHIRQLDVAIEQCPQMRFSDGPAVSLKPVEFGDSVTGFRALIQGESRSAVLVAAYKQYVVELVLSDDAYSDAFFQNLLAEAFEQIDHPN